MKSFAGTSGGSFFSPVAPGRRTLFCYAAAAWPPKPTASVNMARATASDEHAAESAQGLLHLLADAHAHPQLDQDHLARLAGLRVPCVAAMGVAANVDWSIMEKLAGMAGVWVHWGPC
jgi:hypothetical protein